MTHARLNQADAKTHIVVMVWNGDVGTAHYLYHDTIGWYVLRWSQDRGDHRHYLTVDGQGFFEGVTAT